MRHTYNIYIQKHFKRKINKHNKKKRIDYQDKIQKKNKNFLILLFASVGLTLPPYMNSPCKQTNIYFVLKNGKFGIFFNFFNENFKDS